MMGIIYAVDSKLKSIILKGVLSKEACKDGIENWDLIVLVLSIAGNKRILPSHEYRTFHSIPRAFSPSTQDFDT